MPVTFKHEHHNGEVTYREHPGMSLRDWFAGMALQGELAAQDVRNDGRGTGVLNAAELDSHAKWCYLIADAMLRARAVDGGGR